jgi:hypothetical protein
MTNPRTPFNSTAGVSRRASPPLPPIKRSLTASKTPPPINESENKKTKHKSLFKIFLFLEQDDGFIGSISTEEFNMNDRKIKDDNNTEKKS